MRARSKHFAFTAAVVVAAASLLAGCGGQDPSGGAGEPEGPANECIDADGDGFGLGCPAGDDCDDSDPTVWDQCPAPTDPPPGKCTDGATQACKVVLPSHNGVNSCFEGVQTCENGVWGDCKKPTK